MKIKYKEVKYKYKEVKYKVIILSNYKSSPKLSKLFSLDFYYSLMKVTIFLLFKMPSDSFRPLINLNFTPTKVFRFNRWNK